MKINKLLILLILLILTSGCFSTPNAQNINDTNTIRQNDTNVTVDQNDINYRIPDIHSDPIILAILSNANGSDRPLLLEELRILYRSELNYVGSINDSLQQLSRNAELELNQILHDPISIGHAVNLTLSNPMTTNEILAYCLKIKVQLEIYKLYIWIWNKILDEHQTILRQHIDSIN